MTIISQFNGQYRFLSNFYPSRLCGEDGIIYPTLEHYFQAHKCKSKFQRQAVAAADTPGEAKQRGQRVTKRPDWEAVKHQVMMQGLRLKFPSPRASLGELLLRTDDAMLIEGNSWDDHEWGAVYDLVRDKFVGQNWLGSLLMVRRAELRSRLDRKK